MRLFREESANLADCMFKYIAKDYNGALSLIRPDIPNLKRSCSKSEVAGKSVLRCSGRVAKRH